MSEEIKKNEKWLNYKRLQILTIISIIIGCVINFINLGAISTFRHIPIAVRYLTMYSIYICIVLTIVVFMVYPILKLRDANKKRRGEIEKKIEIPKIQENEASENIYCQSCGVEILDKKGEFCSKCGTSLK